MGDPSLGTPQSEDRLDSWKEIAAYLKRDVTTVQRWEKREEMPVHRHLHDRIGSVYASRADLDAWMRSRNLRIGRRLRGTRGRRARKDKRRGRRPCLEAGELCCRWHWRVRGRLARSSGCRGQGASGETL
jgi:Helix-turn-helix domain